MGMMLRRHKRKGEAVPQENGKPVNKEPKTRSLTEKKPTNTTIPTTQR